MKATRALLMVQAVLIEDKGRALTKLSEVFAGKISIDGKPYRLLCYVLTCPYELLLFLHLYFFSRQLDVFDGAGSGDGIDGNPRTSSQQMLVIFPSLKYILKFQYYLISLNNLTLTREWFYRLLDRTAAVQWGKDGEFQSMIVKFVQQGAL